MRREGTPEPTVWTALSRSAQDRSRAWAPLGDGSSNDTDRAKIDPQPLGPAEWQAADVKVSNLATMRKQRWCRLTDAHVAEGLMDEKGHAPFLPRL